MGDSLITIVAIFLAAVLMFVFPLMSMSERTDDVSSLAVQTATTEFVDKVRTTGKLTIDDYDKYVNELKEDKVENFTIKGNTVSLNVNTKENKIYKPKYNNYDQREYHNLDELYCNFMKES